MTHPPGHGHQVDAELEDWEDVRHDFQGSEAGILLGNGASLAIWEHFSYNSLYEIACFDPGEGHLSELDQAIFNRIDTRNYEVVLSTLRTARIVNELLDIDSSEILSRYASIREALIHAIRKVHLPFARMSDDHKSCVCEELKSYKWVFTTNYDLMYYWCTSTQKNQFKDYLWHMRFNPLDTEVRDDPTLVLYLHGGLHLYRDIDNGLTRKRANNHDGGSILEQIENDYENVPLFISEGTSKDKMASIRSNDYLAFAYQKLIEHSGPLVIFGHSLEPAFDEHIIEALNVGARRKYWSDVRYGVSPSNRRVAISIRRGASPTRIMNTKTRLMEALPEMDLTFFDAATHPLGYPSLRITV